MGGVAVCRRAFYWAGDFYRVFRAGACLNEVARSTGIALRVTLTAVFKLVGGTRAEAGLNTVVRATRRAIPVLLRASK